MGFPGGTYLNQVRGLGSRVADEFEQFYALLEGWLRKEHKEDGTHGDLTAESVTVTGAITGRSNGTFDGNVTADADGSPVVTGAMASVASITGPGVSLKAGTTAHWAWITGIGGGLARELALRDVLEIPSASTLRLYQRTVGGSATYNYYLSPGSSVGISLGEDDISKLWDEVNCHTVRASLAASGAKFIPTTFGVTGRLVPAQITADQHNYAINGRGRVFITLDAGHDLTGIAAGFDGELLTISNNSGFSLTVKHQNASSSVGNRLVCPNLADYVVRGGGSVTVQYDTTNTVWWVMGA